MNTQIQEAQLNTYPAYKDSGVEWLGEIPEHWEVLSNKFIFNLKKNLVGKNSRNYELLSLTLRGVVIRNIEDGGKFPAEYDTYQEVNEGDFVFCLFDVEETPRCIGLSKHAGMITGAYTVMESKKSYDSNFLYYFYLNLDTDKRLRPLYTGLRNTISKDDFFAFKTFVPPLSEQTAIANFLDDKCAKIDAAVEIKQQQIELLKERRQIAIHQAVTQGLNKNVPMKDSGVDWIGEIPEHWEVKALKYIGFLKSGETIAPESFKEKGYPVYGGNGFRGYTSTYTNEGFTILIGRQGALCGNVNYANDKFYASEHAVVVYPLNKEEVLWLGETIRMANFNRLSQSAAQPGIAVNIIKNVLFPYPSLCEQKKISKYIKSINKKIDSAISLYEQEIEKLKEYKTTLINSVVTGKIKVNC